MKTAEELWDGYKVYDEFCDKYCLFDLTFENALTEHDAEIEKIIDEMIDVQREVKKGYNVGLNMRETGYEYADQRIRALTELKKILASNEK